jgi:3-hydroxybutyryl-CoA dehydrogenase
MRVAVIGAGTMGSGIAQVAAMAGHRVVLHDTAADAVARGRKAVAASLATLVSKGKLDQGHADDVLARIEPVTALEAVADCGLVIEAIVEDRDVKRDLLLAIETLVVADCILASNTSSLSITELAQGLARPGRLVGMHFFNPAPRMALVEVVTGLGTDPAVAECVLATAKAWGKTPVLARSTPGFIVNRVARPFYGEAMRTLTERACKPATLDAILREGAGFAMGPCELMDLIGLDVNLLVTRSVFEATGFDRRYAPSLIQQELVRAGRFGRKSGWGFYRYGQGAERPAPVTAQPAATPLPVRLVGAVGALGALVERLAKSGVPVESRPGPTAGHLELGGARLALTDGRTATQRAAEEGVGDLLLLDLAADYAVAPRLALARSAQCSEGACMSVVATLGAAGIAISPIDDIAGMVAMRTVVMLANEAADLVAHGVASAGDIDTAMRLGTSYPKGPLAWADELGAAEVARVLDHLRAHYGEERYRVSPALQRLRWSGGRFHG